MSFEAPVPIPVPSRHPPLPEDGSAPGPVEAATSRTGVLHLLRKLEDHWLGDLIGALCLFLSGYIMIVLAGVLS